MTALNSREPWWQTALDVVLPPRCVHCGRRGAEACAACIDASTPLSANICPKCSGPSSGGRTSRACLRQPGQLGAIIARHPYEGLVRSAILALKYRGGTRLLPLLTSMLAESLAARPLTVDLVLPVPLSKSRLTERGFNQAELLAKPVAVEFGWELSADVLRRERDTPQQTHLSARERWANVADAFVLGDPSSVVGCRILIVDDVCTTRATLEACAAPLLRAGAEGVWGLVVARDAPS